MARSLLRNDSTGGFGIVWGMLAVAGTFSVVAMTVFVCMGHKKSKTNVGGGGGGGGGCGGGGCGGGGGGCGGGGGGGGGC